MIVIRAYELAQLVEARPELTEVSIAASVRDAVKAGA